MTTTADAATAVAIVVARMIRDLGPSSRMAASIRRLHSYSDGEEILRAIVRDNHYDVGHIVADALYDLL